MMKLDDCNYEGELQLGTWSSAFVSLAACCKLHVHWKEVKVTAFSMWQSHSLLVCVIWLNKFAIN